MSRPRFLLPIAVALVGVLSACTGTSSSQVEVKAVEQPEDSTTTTLPPDCAEVLPPSAQAGQMLMVMVTGPQLASDALASGKVGGFGLKGKQSADIGDEITAAVADAPVQPFVSSDEEGGTVQRLKAALGTLPSAATLAEGTPEDAATTVGEYAAGMKDLGFNMNFGPVADVGSGSDLGTRSFGDDPSLVSSYVNSVLAAQQQAGILSVVKHWPGIGGGATDPHLALDSLAPVDELRAKDLVPFDRAIAARVPGIMVAHATVPGLTADGEPASLSRPAITDELRTRQGFDGLIITDSLGMGAIVNTTPQDEAAERAVAAGADIALLSGSDVVETAHARLTDAIATKRIPTDQVTASVRRILAAKGIEGECLGLVAAYSALFQNGAPDGGSADEGSTTDSADTTDSTDSSSSGSGQGDTDTGINSTSGSSGTGSSSTSGSGSGSGSSAGTSSSGTGSSGTGTSGGSGTTTGN